MPAIPCQRRFVRPILLGTKRHTIRIRRKRNHVRSGDEVKLYYDWRRPTVQHFATTRCAAVRPMARPAAGEWAYVHAWSGALQELDKGEREQLARNDGFESAEEMDYWFTKTHKGKPLMELDLISWDYPLTWSIALEACNV